MGHGLSRAPTSTSASACRELTKTRVTKQPNHTDPEYVVVRLTDQALFQCPFVLFEDAGTAIFNDQEVMQFREYLLKGGFAFVSDYWGALGQGAVRRSDRPRAAARQVSDHRPADRSSDLAYAVRAEACAADVVDPVVAAERRRKTERGVSDPAQSARAIADAHGRLMVVMVHDSDIPDGWEREGEEHEYFLQFSPDAYSVGIDVLLYALTH